MADARNDPFAMDEGGGAVQFPRPKRSDDEVDMTPMIDCVFLLLIFFLVGSIPDLKTSVELPPARHGAGADPFKSVIVTIADAGENQPAAVYIGDGKVGAPLSGDPAAQHAAIVEALKQGIQEGKTTFMIKAEKSVKHREVSRVASAAKDVESSEKSNIYLAIFEIK
jgi:biopolymer transport protein ExbD